MKFRRNTASGTQHLLMQTFLNVVGVLVVLLALMQMRAQDAVSQAAPGSASAGEAALSSAQQQFDQARAEIERLKKDVDATESKVFESRRKLELNRDEIADLRSKVAIPAPTENDIDVRALCAQLEENQKRLEQLRTSLEKARAGTAALQAELDQLPPLQGAPDPVVVVPPIPRPAPRGADVVEFVCRDGRIASLNEAALRRIAQDRIDRAERELRRSDGIDCEALHALFEKEDIGTKYFRLKIGRDANRPKLLIEYRPNSGETLEEFAALFQSYAKNLNLRRHWIRFRVYSDSFATYLAARDVLRSRYKGFQAGWFPIPDGAVHEIDLQLAGNLACSTQPPPETPVSEPDSRDRVDSLGKKLVGGVKGALEKQKQQQEANARESRGIKKFRKGSKGQPQGKGETVQTLKVQIPTTPANSSVPNDDVD